MYFTRFHKKDVRHFLFICVMSHVRQHFLVFTGFLSWLCTICTCLSVHVNHMFNYFHVLWFDDFLLLCFLNISYISLFQTPICLLKASSFASLHMNTYFAYNTFLRRSHLLSVYNNLHFTNKTLDVILNGTKIHVKINNIVPIIISTLNNIKKQDTKNVLHQKEIVHQMKTKNITPNLHVNTVKNLRFKRSPLTHFLRVSNLFSV